MSQHKDSHKNSLNFLGEKYLNDSHWPMGRIKLLEYIISHAKKFYSQSY